MRRLALLSGLVATVSSFAACGSADPGIYAMCVAGVEKPSSLDPIAGGSNAVVTPDLLATTPEQGNVIFRDAVRAEMNRAVDSSEYGAIVEARCGNLRPPAKNTRTSDSYDNAGAAPTPPQSAGPETGPTQVSGTNNQVAGVDEADFLKNDDKYLYVAQGSSFHVIEAWPAQTAHEIARFAIEGEAQKAFVLGNRAVVYSSLPHAAPPQTSPPGVRSGGGYYPGGGSGCNSYGYGCNFEGDGTQTLITVLDITNRANPVVVRTVKSSSSLISARRIGNTVHTVLAQKPLAYSSYYGNFPIALQGKALKNIGENDVRKAFADLRAENLAFIASIKSANLPTFEDNRFASTAAAMYRSSLADGAAFTSVLSFDMTQESPAQASTILSRAGAVYASMNSLYMAVPHERSSYGWYEGVTEKEVSTVHKFSIGDSVSQTAYLASGVVKGRVLNQFSMDDKDGYLRIATTSGHLPSPDAHNTLTVMGQNGGALVKSGQVDRIAPTEDIRSVRFDGTRGFMVTFKKTDPLYAFDLADPANPRIMGELKIPGFSTYMHLMDATHLLTIGYDADEMGSFAYFNGVLLQIFDVSDITNPTLAHKYRIGTRGSSSEALADHHAFNYFAGLNRLAIPMTVCEGGGNGMYGSTMTFSGLMVFDATTAAGIGLRGQVAHPTAPTGTGYNSQGCSTWWTNASSEVKRSVFMDDWVYSVSEKRIKVNAMSDLSQDVVTLDL